jgi:hypothetical protein
MAQPSDKGKDKTKTKVTIDFPISPKGQFNEEVDDSALVSEVVEDAMTFFEVTADEQHAYYLTFGGKKVDAEIPLSEAVPGKAQAVKFTMIKELVQG